MIQQKKKIKIKNGKEIVKKTKQAINKTKIMYVDASTRELMICPNCHYAIPIISKYCFMCGQAVGCTSLKNYRETKIMTERD